MKKLLVIALAFLATVAFAQGRNIPVPSFAPPVATGWLRMFWTENHVDDFKNGSLTVKRNRNGDFYTTVIGQRSYMVKDALQVYVYQWYVTFTDCNNEFGKVVALNMDGKFVSESDYVHNGNSVGSGIGTMICNEYKILKREYEEKKKQEDSKGEAS